MPRVRFHLAISRGPLFLEMWRLPRQPDAAALCHLLICLLSITELSCQWTAAKSSDLRQSGSSEFLGPHGNSVPRRLGRIGLRRRAYTEIMDHAWRPGRSFPDTEPHCRA